ncbi:competence/damage-inducible protein A [Thermodesulfobacteriota bacterium]
MIAEILSTGEEIRSGAIADTNSAYIAQKLEESGVEVRRHSCVGDDIEAIVSILNEIGRRADTAVVTGGLGPTVDDLTAVATAKAAGVELVLDRPALDSIKAYFKALKRSMNPSNEKQALLPKGAACLLNPVGTAPGFSLKIDKCLFFFLPGVPSEMRLMLSDKVIPRLEALQGKDKEYSLVKTIATFGLTESATGEKLAGFETQFPEIKLGLRVKFPEIHVKFYGRDKDEQALAGQLEAASDWVVQQLGKKVLSVNGSSMEAVIGQCLSRKKATIAVAESCTGGLISHWLTNVTGSSNYFLYAGVAYSNDAKMQVLGVSPDTLRQYGAVHEETVKEMAVSARRIAGATYGLSTSGIAGPDGGTDEKPVGTVCIGLATPDAVVGRRFYFPFGQRSRNKEIFAMSALDMLRRELLAENHTVS